MLLDVLREEKSSHRKGGLYYKMQIMMAYNSNRIEGGQLSEELTCYIYETNTFGMSASQTVNVDDIIKTTNHFSAFDFLIETAEQDLSEEWIKEVHAILKHGMSDARKPWFRVVDYKEIPNEVGGRLTTPPEEVASEMKKLLEGYHQRSTLL